MMKSWVLFFLLSKNYYEIIYLGPHQSLSVSAPTVISIATAYSTREQCQAAMRAVKEHLKADARCLESDAKQ